MTDTHKIFIQTVIENQQATNGDASLTMLQHDIVTGCKAIANILKNGALVGAHGSPGTQNVQGETQEKLDMIANDIFLRSCEFGGNLSGMVINDV